MAIVWTLVSGPTYNTGSIFFDANYQYKIVNESGSYMNYQKDGGATQPLNGPKGYEVLLGLGDNANHVYQTYAQADLFSIYRTPKNTNPIINLTSPTAGQAFVKGSNSNFQWSGSGFRCKKKINH